MRMHSSNLVCGIAVTIAVAVCGCSRATTPADTKPATNATTSLIVSLGRTFLVQGAILAKYRDSGGPSGWLGEPTSSEKPGPKGGRFNEFQSGAIYWTQHTGAHTVSGQILWAWTADGGPDGQLGYPASDEQTVPGGTTSSFEYGTVDCLNGHTSIHVGPASP
ncbi:esterase [Mycobacterium sp.]|uniref:LGFP repeat-containing protein n=1 Tax=Mycobacterium sp. TaxID=1785 RepID=UPI0025CFF00E|nr:esterase [Mycobacterium sp.]